MGKTEAKTRQYPDGPLIFLRSLFLWSLLVLWTFGLGTVASVLALFRARYLIFLVSVFWARVGTVIVGIKVEAEGQDRVYRDGPAHQA